MATKQKVLISGASIAGPSLAFWLNCYGYEVTVVEIAKELRSGGQAVDFKGKVHMAILEKMGILAEVKAANIPNSDGITVDSAGRKIGTIPGAFAGGDINIPRGDLSRIIYQQTSDSCRYIFGETITSLDESPDGIVAHFSRSPSERFDFVVGCDGIHSNVRKLAFGGESEFVTHLGYYYALVQMSLGEEDMMYNEPGKMVALNGSKAPVFFVFSSPLIEGIRESTQLQKQVIINTFSSGKWKLPEILDRVATSEEIYVDSISRVSVEHYSKGRVALLGDAAYGNALGGFGTGLAVVGAYVLAGELKKSNSDYRLGFANYEKKFRNYASVSKKVNAGKLLAPTSSIGIRARNLLFSTLALFGPLMAVVQGPASNIELEDY